ncbi:MAG: sulfur carrier protein ThiS [Candidatus Berkiellales bacterium]
MKIWINDKEVSLEPECDLNAVLNAIGIKLSFFAVALNGNIVPKNNYNNVKLKNDDHIDIIVPMQGG